MYEARNRSFSSQLRCMSSYGSSDARLGGGGMGWDAGAPAGERKVISPVEEPRAICLPRNDQAALVNDPSRLKISSCVAMSRTDADVDERTSRLFGRADGFGARRVGADERAGKVNVGSEAVEEGKSVDAE